jgi:hypothetical protein
LSCGHHVGGCGRVAAVSAWSAVRARVIVVVQTVLRASSLVAGLLITLRKRVRRRVRALVLGRRRVGLRVMLLVNDTRGSRVVQVLGSRRTLLLVVGMMRLENPFTYYCC